MFVVHVATSITGVVWHAGGGPRPSFEKRVGCLRWARRDPRLAGTRRPPAHLRVRFSGGSCYADRSRNGMRVPHRLQSLVDLGIIQDVVRPLMSGKEAQIYVVVAGGEERVAKVYKEADQRSFKQRADYMDGRKVRNSRDRRAMNKGTRHGRAKDEEAWRSAEVDVIYRLRNAGVRVPEPYNFMDGVLIMELVTGEDGRPAPRLGDLSLSPGTARKIHDHVLQEVVRMLCAGVVHGDLSDFNILLSADGPVIIDFPQAVDPSRNANARALLLRDVENLHLFANRVSRRPRLPYAEEMWALYERNELTPETSLRCRFRDDRRAANTREVLDLVGDAERDERRRRRGQGARGRPGASKAPRGPKVEFIVRTKDGRTQTRPATPGNSAQKQAAPRSRRRRTRRPERSGKV
jgi:RIO kinase 1